LRKAPARATSTSDRPPLLQGWLWKKALQRVSLLLPAVLLAACDLPPGTVGELTKPKLRPTQKQKPAETRSNDPPLSPLATQQQVVKAVQLGRPDPFAAVLTPNVIIPPDLSRKTGINTGTKPLPAAPPRPLDWPVGLVFDGVLQSAFESEAFVRYTPFETNGGAIRVGSLRVGDRGTTADTSLLPPGWRVGAIDGEQGVLVLIKGGQSISRRL
jgi:hypothetical protein